MTDVNPVDDFNQALMDLQDSYKKGLRNFAEWLKANWLHETEDKWPHAEPFPGKDFAEGFNNAISTIDMALDCYMEDHAI